MEKKNDEIKKNAAMGASASIGAAAGVVGGSLFTGELRAEEKPQKEEPEVDPGKKDEEEVVVVNGHDGEIRMATTVDDSMSFSEAFAAARAEVGPGGAFEWRGGLYGTYYANEWNNMTEEQKAEYYSHFNFGSSHNGGNVTPDNPEPPTPTPPEPPTPEPPTPPTPPEQKIQVLGGETLTDEQGNKANVAYVKVDGHIGVMADTDQDGKVDIIMVDENDNGKIDGGESLDLSGQGYDMPSIDYPEREQELEVEVLSVETVTDDAGHQMDVANVLVNGHEGVIADVDRNGTADVLVVDANDNGTIEENEIIDLRDEDIEMASLLPPSPDVTDNILYAQTDPDPDYINDANVDDYFA